MIGLLLRKTFYDLWDNLFKIVILNLGFLLCSAIPAFLPVLGALFTDSIILEVILTAIGILACTIYLSAASLAIKPVSDYGVFTFSDFIAAFKTSWRAGLVMGLFVFILFFVMTEVLPFYWSIEHPFFGLALSAIVFWLTVFAILSFQFYFTVAVRLGPGLLKAVKKCVLISFDNTGLAIFLMINNIIALLISIIFIFLFPGPVGVLLYLDEALRLRLLKYDWLEANPSANRRKIPWDIILIEEREKTGVRTFKNFIFPWKD